MPVPGLKRLFSLQNLSAGKSLQKSRALICSQDAEELA